MKKLLLAISLTLMSIIGLTGCDNADKINKATTAAGFTAVKVIPLEDQTMAVDTDGNLWVTGQNVKGEFGNESVAPNGVKQLSWVKVAENVADFSTSSNWSAANVYNESFTLIVKKDGTLWAAGSNGLGQLGNSDTSTSLLNFTQVKDSTGTYITDAKSVVAGTDYALYINTNGDVYGSGSNSLGQLGLASTTSVTTFTKIDIGTSKAAKVVTNGIVNTFNGWGNDPAFTGILTTDSKLLLTGCNWWGQLGNGGTATVTTFTDSGLSSVASVALGPMNTYVISGGNLYAAGDTWQTPIPGLTASSSITSFTQVTVDSSYTLQSVAAGFKTCILKTSTTDVLVLGDNTWGQLGDGTTVTKSVFTPVATSIGISQVSACGTNTFLVGTDDSVWAAGDNYYGAYGNGVTTTDGNNTFVKVSE